MDILIGTICVSVGICIGFFIGYKIAENVLIYKAVVAAENPIKAQPKCGKWIDAAIPNDNGDLLVQVCDQCNTFFPLAYTGGGHNFCPNCGADMRGEQNG